VYEYVGPPLTRESLAAILNQLGIRPATYSLYGAHLPDSYVMDQRSEGWVVFYSDRGDESGLAICRSEADACSAMLDRLTSEDQNFFELVAGPAPAHLADAQFQTWLDEHSVSREQLMNNDWKTQDSPWVAIEPNYRRYWVRITAVRRLRGSS
jgi:hypothetical protein